MQKVFLFYSSYSDDFFDNEPIAMIQNQYPLIFYWSDITYLDSAATSLTCKPPKWENLSKKIKKRDTFSFQNQFLGLKSSQFSRK